MTKVNAKAIARLILPYILFGSLWILLSDRLLERIIHDPALRVQWSIYKGWAYVFVTGILLSFLMHGVLKAREGMFLAYRESERRFSLVFDKSPLGMAITRLSDNKFLDVNDGFTDITGFSKNDAIGHTTLELGVWFDPEERASIIGLLRDKGRVSGLEIRIRCKSGDVIPLLFSAELINLSGEPCMISVAQDISQHKKMEDSLRQQIRLQDQLARLASVVPGMIYSFHMSPDGAMSLPFASDMTKEVFGLPSDTKDASAIFDRIHPDDVDRVRESVIRSAQTLSVWRSEFRVIHPEKGTIWVEGCSTPNRESDGSVLWHGFVYDITERKNAQEQLQHFLISSPALLYVLRIEGTRAHRIWVSDNLQRITGWNIEDSQSDEWWDDNIFPDDRERILGARSTASVRSNQVLEYRFRKRDGTYFWIRDEQRYQQPEGKKHIEVVGTWIDISDQKKLENQFQQAQKMESVGLLAGGIAHDFNNLLTVIKGYAELSLAETDPGESTHENLEEIYRASRQAASLTSQLLAFSRKQILQPEVININDVLEEISKMLKRLIGENIELCIHPCSSLGLVYADLGQLQQIIMNLSVNARDAMPGGGKLAIETANAAFDEESSRDFVPSMIGEFVMLSVSDNGVGMDPVTQARIFDPFFTTKEKGKGTGLGLSTVYGIVKQSNGFIWVYSEKGKGTTFKIYLPRIMGKKPIAIGGGEIRSGLRGSETILVVEDQESVRTLTCRILQKRGYTVMAAADGLEALSKATQFGTTIDLVITDVMMPQMGGKELGSKIKKLNPDIKLLFVSGYTDNAIVHNEILNEGDAFLQKPFSVESLAHKVREILDKGH